MRPVSLSAGGLRRSVSSVPSGAAPCELADGKLLLDEPTDGFVRLTISNPAKRNALDHPILDAISATLGNRTQSSKSAPSA